MEFDEMWNLLEEERLYADENFVPIIRTESARFLYDFVKKLKPKKVLEIGTAIGFSGSIILSAGAESLTTIEIKPESYNIAKNTFNKCGFSCVNMILGDAKEKLYDLIESGEKYDMIFLDGAKGQYVYYLPNLTKLLNQGGIIFADNVLLQGMVESKELIPHRKRTMVVNLRKYLKMVDSSPYETEIVRIEDGIAITKYKGE